MRILIPLATVALAACAPQVPDDRVIEVISDTAAEGEPISAISSEPIETTVVTAGSIEAGAETTGTSLADIELCDAKDYRPLVGQQAGGRQFPTGPSLRVFGVNDIVSQDYVPQRTNIVADDNGMIVRVYCG